MSFHQSAIVVESQGQGAVASQPEKPEVNIQQTVLELATPSQ